MRRSSVFPKKFNNENPFGSLRCWKFSECFCRRKQSRFEGFLPNQVNKGKNRVLEFPKRVNYSSTAIETNSGCISILWYSLRNRRAIGRHRWLMLSLLALQREDYFEVLLSVIPKHSKRVTAINLSSSKTLLFRIPKWGLYEEPRKSVLLCPYPWEERLKIYWKMVEAIDSPEKCL